MLTSAVSEAADRADSVNADPDGHAYNHPHWSHVSRLLGVSLRACNVDFSTEFWPARTPAVTGTPRAHAGRLTPHYHSE